MVWVGKRQEARGLDFGQKRQEIKDFIVFYTYLLKTKLIKFWFTEVNE
jgi:hypothetical protein